MRLAAPATGPMAAAFCSDIWAMASTLRDRLLAAIAIGNGNGNRITSHHHQDGRLLVTIPGMTSGLPVTCNQPYPPYTTNCLNQ
ncbi:MULTISPECIES: hypothetical protein [Aquitalea]|uniref:hypothetical protein n=1 Tax=Aquitalea TaxID=407217 RepID=UPI000F5A6DE4|nr:MULTISPECIES: hypothetical protein [Aquitalea]